MAKEVHETVMKFKTLTRDETSILILMSAFIFGGVFRFMPAALAGFPVNDGGMFYVMMNDLQANHFLPPLYTTYNNLNIPFAYPPLGFYIGAAISSWFNISGIEIIRWLPAVFNTVCLIAFYFLSIEIFEDKLKGATATFVFSLTPQVNVWLSAGGGLTRSLGTLFMLLTVLYAHRMFVRDHSKAFWGVVIFGSFTVLSHTESTVLAIILPIYIWLLKSRKSKGLIQGILIVLGVMIIAGPWYLMVIHRHGIDPLLSALRTGSHSFWSFLRLINVDGLTSEPYLDLFGVLGILGIVLLVTKREYFLPLMLLVLYIAQPRSANTTGNIPMAMAAGAFVVDALIPIYLQQTRQFSKGYQTFIPFLIIAPYILVNSIYQGFLLSTNHVAQDERAAMQWIAENTPADSRFIVLTGESDAMCESVAEWFPALSKRQSLTTLQGREWLSNVNFIEFVEQRNKLQTCINNDVNCLDREVNFFGTQPDYVYISIQSPTEGCKMVQTRHDYRSIILSLMQSDNYIIAHQSKSVMVFQNK
ncbi:MAG: glycosyltransferase family 39 protein [Anaerolineales bacterium]|nr:glycosyltransferase family 39 protein [Anaerolineales bacterium]